MILCLFLVFGACFCSCAQSGNGRHNSHQRKIHQQEESCQNLTDFTPARVPSKVDIFTAYNDSLQCSHECVRTAVPIYTDEMIQQTPVYKTAYNGNRYGGPSTVYRAKGGCTLGHFFCQAALQIHSPFLLSPSTTVIIANVLMA